ncbi:OmpA family protein [Pontixanthobacter sp. CEM42]|uniref:OmpA family protein n=1 Tax=Pontixanthobacter sp. CEM42 TaxID=2792077 RepID=UPI001ADEFCD1|nr:OmpA family protein [Pontixanthobacter sp. CEM42]
MKFTSTNSKLFLLSAAMAIPMSVGASAQEQEALEGEYRATVYGSIPGDLSELEEGPEIEGFISARADDRIQITSVDGTRTEVRIGEATVVKASGGFLGLARKSLGADALLNGLPVEVETVQWGRALVASQVDLKNKDMKTAAMIRSGTEQGFAEQTAATDALRGRVGDIDQYNLKDTTNVYFDTGMANLSEQDKANLCSTAAKADAMDNALMLVVGYTDSTGSQDVNQRLSEKRAGRVVNYLQQACGWKPYRMLTPTGMAEADPAADNNTDYGKSQNRRVAVNILVSKSVDGL